MKVPLLDLKPQYCQIQDEVEAAARKALRETTYILGAEVGELETALARYAGTKHAVGCASGSDALLLALMALDIGPDDEVITTPFTFFATASAIVRLGAKPVFVDIDPKTFNISPTGIAAKLTKRTKAILPVHLYGQCADMDVVLEFGLPVVEDAAQAIGAQHKGRHAGTMGTLGTLSFFPTKNLGGAGDGGALLTNDDQLSARLRMLRVHGSARRYHHDEVGINSRLDTLQAAMLLVKLRHLDTWTLGRQRNAQHYTNLLRGLVTTPWTHPDCVHVFNQYTIRTSRRDALRDHLTRSGIGSEIYYPVPLHLQKCFRYLGYSAGDFPEAERAAAESLSLPIFPELTVEQLDYVAETIVRFL